MLRERDMFFALNHLFHFYDGQMPMDAYLGLLDEVPALETRNGAMLAAHNALIEAIARDAAAAPAGRCGVAGSDAHTLRRVGTTWTSSARRATRERVPAGPARRTRPSGGAHGGTSHGRGRHLRRRSGTTRPAWSASEPRDQPLRGARSASASSVVSRAIPIHPAADRRDPERRGERRGSRDRDRVT